MEMNNVRWKLFGENTFGNIVTAASLAIIAAVLTLVA
jgi:hypothetical protein